MKGQATRQAEAIRGIARARGIPFARAAAFFRRLYDAPIPTNIKVGALQAAQAGLAPVPTSVEVSADGDEAEYTLHFDGISATEKRRELFRRNPDWDEHVARQVDWLRMIAVFLEVARGGLPHAALPSLFRRFGLDHGAMPPQDRRAIGRQREIVPRMASIDVDDVLAAPRPGPLLALARP